MGDMGNHAASRQEVLSLFASSSARISVLAAFYQLEQRRTVSYGNLACCRSGARTGLSFAIANSCVVFVGGVPTLRSSASSFTCHGGVSDRHITTLSFNG